MIKKLIFKNIDDINNINNVQREIIGKRISVIGIILNITLSLVKIISGLLFNSVSILADGFNNLADTANSIISLISFKYSNKPADKEHPYGHERVEYVASLVVGISIILLSVELARGSIAEIMNPVAPTFSYLLVILLGISIAIKLWLYYIYKNCSETINSTVLLANAKDSINDVFATGAVLISLYISTYLNINTDGFMGLVVSIIVFLNGFGILKESTDKIIGEAPDKGMIEDIETRIRNYDGVIGIHDLIVHSYGTFRTFVSVHVEVDSNVDVLISHDLIDSIEQDFLENDNIHLVIHMDPIILDNPETNQLKKIIMTVLKDMKLEMHDFRIVLSSTHSTVVFECVIPYDIKISEEEITEKVSNSLQEMEHLYLLNITFERPFNS